MIPLLAPLLLAIATLMPADDGQRFVDVERPAATVAAPAAPRPPSISSTPPAPSPAPVPPVVAEPVDEPVPATDSPMCDPSSPELVPAFPDCWWNPDDGPEPPW